MLIASIIACGCLALKELTDEIYERKVVNLVKNEEKSSEQEEKTSEIIT
ncbi:MAG: hypothetical protein PV340_00105 [Wolbachia sp.]|nr:hypothetical protein [Wolbachia sp.]MDD9336555.1 hypothetical protein [Wolbachia sp.]